MERKSGRVRIRAGFITGAGRGEAAPTSSALTSENRAKALSTQLEIEKEHVAEAAELDTLRDKVRRLEAVARDRDRASVREVSQLEKRIEELSADVRAKQSKLNKQEQELRSAIASTDKEASFLQKMEEQFDDDSYEAVLLEELSEMRARFQDKLDKLQESCNDIERRCRAELRIERDGWATEKQGLESRYLAFATLCAVRCRIGPITCCQSCKS